MQSLGYRGVDAKKGKISKLDIQDPTYERHVTMGWNYRMPELCAAVALAQLERIEQLVDVRVQAAKRLNEVVRECNWLIPPASARWNDQHLLDLCSATSPSHAHLEPGARQIQVARR